MNRCDLCDNEYEDDDMVEPHEIEEAGLEWCTTSLCRYCLEEKLEEESIDEMYHDIESEYYREEHGDDMLGTIIASGEN